VPYLYNCTTTAINLVRGGTTPNNIITTVLNLVHLLVVFVLYTIIDLEVLNVKPDVF
jgi:hypothetical protein